MKERIYEGIGVSPGIVISEVLVYGSQKLEITACKIACSQVDTELETFLKARAETKTHLESIYEKACINLGEEEAEVFEGHIEILMDEDLEEAITEMIRDNFFAADRAIEEVYEEQARDFDEMENEYMAERAADIRSIKRMLIAFAKGLPPQTSLDSLEKDVVVVAEDLEPADTATMDKSHVLGFATERGGRTSHVSIMAKSLEIPAVISIAGIKSELEDGDSVIIDGTRGLVIVHPAEETLARYEELLSQEQAQKKELEAIKDLPAETQDGHRVELAANIGTPDDLEGVLSRGADGVGLFRSEFLFMNATKMPEEEQQFEAYKKVVAAMEGKPVIIRTLDIGGDKAIPYLNIAKEENPFLGFRAIRLCLAEKEMFLTQLRAILRASAFGKARIMLPMISGLEELREARGLVQQAMGQLDEQGQGYDKDIEVGIMIETPAAVAIADLLIKEADFFSIGTNDLTGYTIAVDRGNPQVSYLYEPYHPAVMRGIARVIEASHAEGKWTGMCGEFAGDTRATKLLLALGLDEFSMSASSLGEVKRIIRSVRFEDLKDVRAKLFNLETTDEVLAFAEQISS